MSRVAITARELIAATSGANKSSATGHDGISYAHISRLCDDDQILNIILESMNAWVNTGFPASTKKAKIVPIPKGQSTNSGYRPISLLSCISKLVERIITSKIQRVFENELLRNQCGCRAMLSTTHYLTRLLHASSTANCKDQLFGVVLLDFSKAYDRVNHNILLDKLMRRMKLPSNLTRAIYFWLKDRSFFVEIGNCQSTERSMHNGLPQGSALSVILSLSYINDIPIEESNSAIFMDDTCVW